MTEPHTPWQSLRQRWQQVQRVPDDEALQSPCVSVCITKSDVDECHGCLRTLDEIARWGMSSPQQQRAVWHRIALRLDHHFNKA